MRKILIIILTFGFYFTSNGQTGSPLRINKFLIDSFAASSSKWIIYHDSTHTGQWGAIGSGGGGGGAGTVTSVAQSFTGGLISVAGSPITTSGTLALTVSGTSGGVPYFSSTSTWASSGLLTANALMIGGGAGAAPSTTTTGTGVLTALGINVGSAGAFVTFNGALGTPSSGTLTNATGLPEGGLSLTDITTNNTSTTQHGFFPKLTSNTVYYVNNSGALTVLPLGANGTVLTSNGTTSAPTWETPSGGGASVALDNLSGVAINAALVLGTSDAFALGSTTKQWSDLFLAEGGVINWDNGDATITQTGNSVALAGADFTVAGQVSVTGSTGAFAFNDRTTAEVFNWYATGGGAILYNNAAGAQIVVQRNQGNGLMTAGTNTTPTAFWHLRAGTATATQAPLKFTSGTNLTTPEAGAVEFDGTNYFVTSSTTRYTVAKTLTNTATLDFGSTAAGAASDLTVTVTGAAVGDAVYIGVDNASVTSDNIAYWGWVSSTNTVTVRFNNANLVSAVDPASGTFRVVVTKY